jgi:exonuclease III
MTWNMAGPSNAAAKWAFVKQVDPDVVVLQETMLPAEQRGLASRRVVKPAMDRDDVVIIGKGNLEFSKLPESAYGQALEVKYEDFRLFGVRSYIQVKEYYPKALLRIVDAIGMSLLQSATPTMILGDFNASLDQSPGRDWTPPFKRLIELGFVDAFCIKSACAMNGIPCAANHGKTLRTSKGRYRIDQIHVNAAMASRLSDIRIIEDGWALSDHCPVVADFV